MEYDTSQNKIQGWMRDADLLWLFNTAKEMENIVEVGSWKGRSTHALLSGCKGTVYAVDHFLGSRTEIEAHKEAGERDISQDFIENVGSFKNLKVLKMDSRMAVHQFEDNSVDMVFIDAGHTYEEVLEDIKRWLPKAKKIICGHDRCHWPVKKAVRSMFGDDWEANERRGNMWIKKIPSSVVPEEEQPKIMAEIKQPTVGIIYYTDNELDENLMKACQKQLLKVSGGKKIVSVSLKPIDFGQNIVLPLSRERLTMFKQILTALLVIDTDIVFFSEHDVLYPPSHFDFIPPDRNVWYYNGNYWFLRLSDGHTLHYDATPLSGLCVYRDIAIKHYQERIAMVEKDGRYSHSMGYEPMVYQKIQWENMYTYEIFKTASPVIDIKHGKNLTEARWTKDLFQRKPTGWEEGTIDTIPGWDNVRDLLPASLQRQQKNMNINIYDEHIKKKYNVLPGEYGATTLPITRDGLVKLFRKFGYLEGVEIGTSSGPFAERICKIMPLVKLYCVDSWMVYDEWIECKKQAKLDQHYEVAKARLAPYNCELIKGFSRDAAKNFKDNSLDFVFIDANHSFEAVIEDIAIWTKKVKPGGIISGHDFWNSSEGYGYIKLDIERFVKGLTPEEKIKICQVKDAVIAWTNTNKISPWYLTGADDCSCWFWIKQ
jgi:predicted O-methyltransferase YrrM